MASHYYLFEFQVYIPVSRYIFPHMMNILIFVSNQCFIPRSETIPLMPFMFYMFTRSSELWTMRRVVNYKDILYICLCLGAHYKRNKERMLKKTKLIFIYHGIYQLLQSGSQQCCAYPL